VGLQRLVHVVQGVDMLAVVQVVDLEEPLHVVDAFLGQGDVTVLFIDLVIDPVLQVEDDLVEEIVFLGGFLGGSGNNEGRPRFVDKDRVDLVNDGIIQLPLDPEALVLHHVVPEIIKTELVVGSVGDIAPVGHLALVGRQVMLDDPHLESQELVYGSHPFGVAPGQVVVDGDDMYAVAAEGVQVYRERRDQGLSFTGLHLGDPALMEHDASHHLHVKMPHAKGPHRGLTGQGEGFGKQAVEGLTLLYALAELRGHGAHFVVGELFHLRLEGVDFVHNGPQLLDVPLMLGAEEYA